MLAPVAQKLAEWGITASMLEIGVQLGLIVAVFFALQMSAAVLVYMERKVAAFVQQRYGPYLVGPRGLLQPIADIVKLAMKEELRPKSADALLFYAAPMISATAAFAAFTVVPFGADTTLFGLLERPIHMAAADVNVGLLVIFAITSMGVYGIVLAGWASNSKYSLLGGLRASAQMISYELSYGLSFAAVIMLAGSLSLREIVDAQSGYWFGFIPQWYIFIQPLGFLIFLTAGVAETNRAPFDFPEAEQELVAGYHTEYSSMSFALFFLAEYINMVTVSAVATDLFLGGWHGPFLPEWLGFIWFFIKLFALLFFYIWMRWTLPRYRYDQLMEFGWKYLLPAAVLNLLVTAGFVVYMGWQASMDALMFWVFALVTVVASLLVVGQRNPMYSVLLLILSFCALSGLYVLLGAPFVAVIQIIIYAGAIIVLFLFVVMLLNVPTEDPPTGYHARLLGGAGPRRFGAVLSVALLALLTFGALFKLAPAPLPGRDVQAPTSVYDIGLKLFREYGFAFEATSVLILVAMVGAMILARKESH